MKIESQNPVPAASSLPSAQQGAAQGGLQAGAAEAASPADFSQTLSSTLQSSVGRPAASGLKPAANAQSPAATLLVQGLNVQGFKTSVAPALSPGMAAAAPADKSVTAILGKPGLEKPGSKPKDATPSQRLGVQASDAGTVHALSLIALPALPVDVLPVAVRPTVPAEAIPTPGAGVTSSTHGDTAAPAVGAAQGLQTGTAVAPVAVTAPSVATPTASESAAIAPINALHAQASAAIQRSSDAPLANGVPPRQAANETSTVANASSPVAGSEAASPQSFANSQQSPGQAFGQSSGREAAGPAKPTESATSFAGLAVTLPPATPQADLSALQGQGSPVAQAQPGAAASAAPQAGAAQINSASVLQGLHGSEMRVGLHSPEFGSISIATTLSSGNVAAQITLDHAALSRALAAHLPGIEEKLGSALGGTAKVEMQSSASFPQAGGQAGGQAGSGGGTQTSQQAPSHSAREPLSASSPAPLTTASPPARGSIATSERLSIQA